MAQPLRGGAESNTHTHCICGAEHKTIGDHTAENEITFVEWTDELAATQNGEGKTAANSLPSEAGNYYLAKDVTLTETWKPTDNTVLCLSGNEISISLGKYTTYTEVVCIEDGIKFDLTDCSNEQGKIKGTNHDDINQTLRIKGSAVLNMYGGSIEGEAYDTFHPIFGIQLGDNSDEKTATFNMYGGAIANALYGIRVRDTLNIYGGSINNCAEYGVEFDNSATTSVTASMTGGSIHDCGCGVYNPRDKNIFNMSNGNISNNGKQTTSNYKPQQFGGVNQTATFNMSGGTIEGNNNNKDSGAGISGGTVNMYGGSIKNNIGGGVHASNIKISGSSQIENNKLTDESGENLYIYSGKTITIETLSETAKIGMTSEVVPTAGSPVTFTSGAVEGYENKIFSDNDAYEVSKNDNGTLALKLKKVKPNLSETPTASATYGQKLGDITLINPTDNTSGTWEWMDKTASVGEVSDSPKTFKAKFIPSDTDTYSTVENIDISVTVNPKSLTDDMIKIYSKQADYTGSALEAKFTVYEGETPLVKDVDYEIVSGGTANEVGANELTIKGLGNYTGNAVAEWSLKKADGKVGTLPSAASDLTYNNSDQQLIKELGSGTGDMVFSLTENGKYTSDISRITGKAAKRYEVWYKASESNNYNESEAKSLEVTIEKAKPTGEPAYTAITQTGKTLADAELKTGTITPAEGTIVWDLGNAQTVSANTEYAWTFTPANDNYSTLTGKITVWSQASNNPNGGNTAGGSGGGGGAFIIPTVQKPEIIIDETQGKFELSKDGTTVSITPNEEYEIDSVTLNGTEKGVVDKITGLKTGDKVVITFKKKSVNDGASDAESSDIKEQLTKIQIVARSSKTVKRNIKVTLKMNEETVATIQELKDLGYTVKYKYYRSTKKTSKYVGKIAKTSKSFTNTKGTKGTKYYYKARVQVYDADGKMIAQTALKQCKYASRKWTK